MDNKVSKSTFDSCHEDDKYPFLEIIWMDAYEREVWTVGYLIKENNKYLMVSQSITGIDFSDWFIIPKERIKRTSRQIGNDFEFDLYFHLSHILEYYNDNPELHNRKLLTEMMKQSKHALMQRAQFYGLSLRRMGGSWNEEGIEMENAALIYPEVQ